MWNCIKGCINFLLLLVLLLVLFVMFDWLGAREAVEAAINWQGDVLVTLSNWGDDLQEVLGMGRETAAQAEATLERAQAAVERAAP